MLSGLGATVLLFALGLLFTALWRRYFSESYYYLEDKGSDAGEEKTSNFTKIRKNEKTSPTTRSWELLSLQSV